jgi:hypothetical protein
MSWVALGAAAVSAAGSIYSSSQNKAKAPATVPYQNIDPTQVQDTSISGDISSLPNANLLATTSGESTAQQAVAERNITQPGYSQLAGNLSSDANNLAANPYSVPQSVVDQLSQYAAENNIGEGTGADSGFSQSNLLRSLGVNQLQYGQTNLGLATSALSTLSGTAPNISPVSPLSFLLTPSQSLAAQTNNATQNQAIGQGAANASAAAANQNSANLFDTISGQIGPLTSAGAAALGGNNAGVGAQTSYASFLANNPGSSAAVGQSNSYQ